MDNIKYPKKSHFVEDLSADSFGSNGDKLLFKNEGVIIDKSFLKTAHFTNDGASGARFLEFKNDAACYLECSYEAGFAIKQKYHTPGKGNKFPVNHVKGAGFYQKISPVSITSGIVDPASLRLLEKGVLEQIKAYHDGEELGRFFTAFKGMIITTSGTPTATITLNGTASATVAMTVAGIKAVTGMMAIELSDGSILVFALEDGDNFTLTSLVTTAVTKEGIIVVGNDPEVSIEVHQVYGMDAEFTELFALSMPAVTGKTYSLKFLGEGLAETQNVASASALSLTNLAGTVDGDNVYITSEGTKTLKEIVILPGTAVSIPATFIFAAAGAGAWPTMTTQSLRERFIGKYRGMFGKNQVVPSAKRHVELSFVITGSDSALSGGASTKADFETRVSFVIPYDIYKANTVLTDLVATL